MQLEMNWRADAALPASAAPQSSQNADEGAFSAPHFGQRRGSGLPHAAQNFLLVVLSVPHLVQRMRPTLRTATDLLLYHPASRGDQQTAKDDRNTPHRQRDPDLADRLNWDTRNRNRRLLCLDEPRCS